MVAWEEHNSSNTALQLTNLASTTTATNNNDNTIDNRSVRSGEQISGGTVQIAAEMSPNDASLDGAALLTTPPSSSSSFSLPAGGVVERRLLAEYQQRSGICPFTTSTTTAGVSCCSRARRERFRRRRSRRACCSWCLQIIPNNSNNHHSSAFIVIVMMTFLLLPQAAAFSTTTTSNKDDHVASMLPSLSMVVWLGWKATEQMCHEFGGEKDGNDQVNQDKCEAPWKPVTCTDVEAESLTLLQRRMMLLAAGAAAAATVTLGAPQSTLALDKKSSIQEEEVASKDEQEPQECRNGAIVQESQIPGAYQQECMNLKQRTIPLRSTGEDLILSQQATSVDSKASYATLTGRTGVAVWNSGLLLARLLDILASMGGDDDKLSPLQNKTVVELGCGAGLVSIVAAKLGASSVWATDANPEVLALAGENAKRNGILPSVLTVAPLSWGSLLDEKDESGLTENMANIILGSDLTYNANTWPALGQTMDQLLRYDKHSWILYLTLGHSGFTSPAEVGGFLSLVESVGNFRQVFPGDAQWPFAALTSSSLTNLVLNECVSSAERDMILKNGGVQVVVLARKGL